MAREIQCEDTERRPSSIIRAARGPERICPDSPQKAPRPPTP